MKSFCASIALISLLLVSGVALAAQGAAPTVSAPTLVRIDGQLTTPTGEPRTGSAALTVSLYATKDDSTPLWVEQQVVTLDAAGRYTVFAGATLPDGVPQEFFSGATSGRWLGVGVQGEAEQFRMMLVTVPYAAKAREAETLAGKSATDFVLSENLGDTVKKAFKSDLIKGGSSATGGPGTFGAGTLGTIPKCSAAGNPCDLVDSLLFSGATGVDLKTTFSYPTLNVESTTANGGILQLKSSTNFWQTYNQTGDLRFYSSTAAAGDRLTISGAGNVGIGTTAPSAGKLVLAADTNNLVFASAAGVAKWYAYLQGSDLRFYDTGDRFIIQSGGNVGIGTATPSQKLDVQGNINVSGNINAKYQDVAEWVETSAPIEAGTVVIVDPLNPNRVLTAPGAYDTRVAGAVSKQPGLVLGEKSETNVMVAQSGRVRIKVDAKYGAIKIGDLLVTSPTPGYAMLSKPMKVGGGQTMHRPGTLLGKALEALPNGQGEILVLLTLQ